eukprot:2293509-Amphidinium_carterae.2
MNLKRLPRRRFRLQDGLQKSQWLAQKHAVLHLPNKRAQDQQGKRHSSDRHHRIGLDYGYLHENAAGEDEVSLPMLAGKDSKQGWHFASIPPCKWINHPFCVKETTQLLASGFQTMMLRSDGKPLMLDLKWRVLLREQGAEVLTSEAAEGGSDGNGLAEQEVKDGMAKAQVLKLQAEIIHGVELWRTWPIVAWIPFFAALSMNPRMSIFAGK